MAKGPARPAGGILCIALESHLALIATRIAGIAAIST